MRVISYNSNESLNINASTVTALGFFDGVHIGHRELIRRAVLLSQRMGLVPTVFTFSSGDEAIKSNSSRIYQDSEKYRIFESLGIELVVTAEFSSMKDMPREVFVKDFLIKTLGTRVAVVGKDFRFGKGATGNADYLGEVMNSLGADTVALDMETVNIDGIEREVSSTLIRTLLGRGQVSLAGTLLGEPYHIVGRVEHGRGEGRGFGYPTVNISLQNNSPLANGVYHTTVKIGEKLYTGLTNVGVCPSFKERERHTETFILDFDGDAYGKEVHLLFIDFIREERVFSSAEELGREIERNIAEIKRKI